MRNVDQFQPATNRASPASDEWIPEEWAAVHRELPVPEPDPPLVVAFGQLVFALVGDTLYFACCAPGVEVKRCQLQELLLQCARSPS